MANAFGKLVVGGGALVLSYRFFNASIDSFTQKNKYSVKSMKERSKFRPEVRAKNLNRNAIINEIKNQSFDVIIVGGNLEASELALDLSSSGEKILLIDTEDFDSNLSEKFLLPCSNKDLFLHLKNSESLSEIILDMRYKDKDFEYLKNAPHMTSVIENVLLYPDYLSLLKGYLHHKFSDILLNKPPKFSSRFSTKVPPWADERKIVGGVLVHNIIYDTCRLNLATILSAVDYGTTALNHVAITSIIGKNEEDILEVHLKDTLAKTEVSLKSKNIIKMKKSDEADEIAYCFKINKSLLDANHGFDFGNSDALLYTDAQAEESIASVLSCNDHREAFQLLKKLISKYDILRKGDLTSFQISKNLGFSWESIDANALNKDYILRKGDNSSNYLMDSNFAWKESDFNGAQNFKSHMNPITGKVIKTKYCLRGSHGWFPELHRVISSKYGLPLDLAKHLVAKFGDKAADIAEKVTMTNIDDLRTSIIEVETTVACDEMCVTVKDACKRIKVKYPEEVQIVAKTMQNYYHWTDKETKNHETVATEWLKDKDKLESWKIFKHSEFDENTTFLNKEKDFFKANASKFGKINQSLIEQHLKNSNIEYFSKVDYSLLNEILREVDAECNGMYNEEEFLELMKIIYVKTPEEVIENHINSYNE